MNRERKKASRMNKVATMIEEIKQYREVMASMVHDLKEKQDRASMLEEEKAKLPKNLNRALYTHRIMDITSSIGKSFCLFVLFVTSIQSQSQSHVVVSLFFLSDS